MSGGCLMTLRSRLHSSFTQNSSSRTSRTSTNNTTFPGVSPTLQRQLYRRDFKAQIRSRIHIQKLPSDRIYSDTMHDKISQDHCWHPVCQLWLCHHGCCSSDWTFPRSKRVGNGIEVFSLLVKHSWSTVMQTTVLVEPRLPMTCWSNEGSVNLHVLHVTVSCLFKAFS